MEAAPTLKPPANFSVFHNFQHLWRTLCAATVSTVYISLTSILEGGRRTPLHRNFSFFICAARPREKEPPCLSPSTSTRPTMSSWRCAPLRGARRWNCPTAGRPSQQPRISPRVTRWPSRRSAPARTSSNTASRSATRRPISPPAAGCTPTTLKPTFRVRLNTPTPPTCTRWPPSRRKALWASAGRTDARPSAMSSGSSRLSAASTTLPRRLCGKTRILSPAASKGCTPFRTLTAAPRPGPTTPRPASCLRRWPATRTPAACWCFRSAAKT